MIGQMQPDCFVAILDDDDAWDPNHIEANVDAATRNSAEVVVSGLRLLVDGVERERHLIMSLTDRDFMVGNPGWQGSNTFVQMRLMQRVGGFREGLSSLNDRDLAIRLLRVPGVRVAYPRTWTSTWHIRSNVEALSTPRSAAKLSGLQRFWRIYGTEMSGVESARFFERASRLFAIEQDATITADAPDLPPCQLRGDLLDD